MGEFVRFLATSPTCPTLEPGRSRGDAGDTLPGFVVYVRSCIEKRAVQSVTFVTVSPGPDAQGLGAAAPGGPTSYRLDARSVQLMSAGARRACTRRQPSVFYR